MTAPADTLLRFTPLYHGGKRGEAHDCSKGEFAHDNEGTMEPDNLRVMALQPGETMILGGGAAGAWEVRCLTEADKMAARYRDDGTCSEVDGVPIDVACEAAALRSEAEPPWGEAVRYEFADGSAIVTAEGEWDIGFPGHDLDCWCWDDGKHDEDCRGLLAETLDELAAADRLRGEAPPDVRRFLAAVVEVCRRHGLSIGHEDTHGAFLVEPLSDDNIEWLLAARPEPRS